MTESTAQVLDLRKFSPALQNTLDRCAIPMDAFEKKALTLELFFCTLLKHDKSLSEIIGKPVISKLLPTVEALARQRTVGQSEIYHRANDGRILWLGSAILRWLDSALTTAEKMHEAQLRAIHLLADPPARIGDLLAQSGLTREALDKAVNTAPPGTPVYSDLLKKYRDTGDALYPRQTLLDTLQTWLAVRHAERHIILLGENGVGKQSLVHALAVRIARGENPASHKAVIIPDERALLDNPRFTLKASIQAARDGILFLPHLGRFFRSPRQAHADFPDAVTAILHAALLDPRLTLIATESPSRYTEYLQTPLIGDTCRTLPVPPPSSAESQAILEKLRPAFERDYRLTIVPDSLPLALQLAERYHSDTPRPASALRLLHYTAALVSQSGRTQLDGDDLRIAVSLLSGIPLETLTADDRARYAQMESVLREKIIGQDTAIHALSRAIQAARVGLKDPHRPIATFLLLGPTGVGKTETAKALADFIFGSPTALITLDMSEYMSETSATRLIGAPPGYVGYQAGGQLTGAVKAKPYSVILFDEIEKAAPRIFDLLLQILDEGRLTDGQGQTVSFRDGVILLTSNIDEKDLARHFRPEFLNRLDGIVPFTPLDSDALARILDLMLAQEVALLAERGLQLEVSQSAKTWLLARHTRPDWGARPLRRIIAEHLRAPLAQKLLQNETLTRVRMTVRDGIIQLMTGENDDQA